VMLATPTDTERPSTDGLGRPRRVRSPTPPPTRP
jgi:hypothetical protein